MPNNTSVIMFISANYLVLHAFAIRKHCNALHFCNIMIMTPEMHRICYLWTKALWKIIFFPFFMVYLHFTFFQMSTFLGDELLILGRLVNKFILFYIKHKHNMSDLKL
jgi:hypothetical protein